MNTTVKPGATIAIERVCIDDEVMKRFGCPFHVAMGMEVEDCEREEELELGG